MSVSLYYTARRSAPLTEAERNAVARITAERASSFPYEDEEALYLYDEDGASGEGGGEVLAGSTKMPFDPGRLLPVIAHVLDSVTALRRALPDADWHVHLDDLDIPWDQTDGYALPGLRDPDLATDLEGL